MNQLRIHITVAHKANFFKKELIRWEMEDGKCVKDEECGHEAETVEEAIVHVAVDHEQVLGMFGLAV